MKISWKNIENWRSWKMSFFWGGHFEFLCRPFWIFFLLHFIEKCSPFLWGIIFFCTMDGFSRILEKKLSELLCTRLYHCYTCSIIFIQVIQWNVTWNIILIWFMRWRDQTNVKWNIMNSIIATYEHNIILHM